MEAVLFFFFLSVNEEEEKKFLPYPLFPHLFSSFCPVNNFLKNGKHVQRTFQTYEASKR